jgi:hypothetical protein
MLVFFFFSFLYCIVLFSCFSLTLLIKAILYIVVLINFDCEIIEFVILDFDMLDFVKIENVVVKKIDK